MEGLVPAPTTQRPAHRADEQRIIERWLAGAVVAIVVVIATAALLARLSGA